MTALLRRILAMKLLGIAVHILPPGLSKLDLIERVQGYAANENWRVDIELKATKARFG